MKDIAPETQAKARLAKLVLAGKLNSSDERAIIKEIEALRRNGEPPNLVNRINSFTDDELVTFLTEL